MKEEYKGSNGLKQRDLYYERKKYKESAFTKNNLQRPIDFLYEDPNYGYRNSENETIFLFVDNSRASLLPFDSGRIEGVAFFVEAFTAFREKFLEFTETNNLTIPEDLGNLTPIRGFSDPQDLYKEYRKSIIDIVIQEYALSTKIHNFDDFVSCVDEFIEDQAAAYPITLSGFLDSGACTILSTGLAFDLSQKKASSDENKNKILTNWCFQCYCSYANDHGLLVDKNAPWRIVADLDSPQMRPYILKYGAPQLTNRQILDTRFYAKSHYDDLRDLQDFYLEAYQKFIVDNPFALVYDRYERKYVERKSVLWFEESKYDSEFWFRLLLRVRFLESGQTRSKDLLEKSVADVMHINRLHGFVSATAKIGNLIAKTRKREAFIDSFQPTKLKEYL